MTAVTAASVPGGESSDVPEDGYGPRRRERIRRAREEPAPQAWPDLLAPDHEPPGRCTAQPPGDGDRVAAAPDAPPRTGRTRDAWSGAGSPWPTAGEGGQAAPAQVFRPEHGGAPAPDEAETDASTAPGPAEKAPPRPALPPEPARERPAPPGNCWDDGLIARRAPRTPAAGAEPTSRTTGRVSPVHRWWPAYDDVDGRPVDGRPEDGRPVDGRPVGETDRPGSGDGGRQAPRPDEPHVPGAAVHGFVPHLAPWGEADRCAPHTEDTPEKGTPSEGAPEKDAPSEGPPSGGTPVAGGAATPGTPPARPSGRGERGYARPAGGGGLPSLHGVGAGPIGGTLRRRLSALRELIGLSRTRLEGRVLAEAGRVLDEAGARAQLSAAYTTVALAGATGSGKSSLLNALAGRTLSETGLRRPTTAQPVACTWEAEREGGADGLLDRLGIAPTMRRRVKDAGLHGLVLIDLPDHDSVAPGHREHVDRLLELVDAVVWVVDPEKYADAILHERYLRPLAGYAEVTFVVLNQVDRLPGEAADAVLHDLRRLLDEDGMALGDYGEPGARVLATSALTGEGMGELREELGAFAATREAPARRLTADLDGAAERLRPVYADPGLPAPAGLTDADREEFEDLLASAVGACAAGQAAERAWLRHAERSCGTPWSQLVRWRDERERHRRGVQPAGATGPGSLAAPDDLDASSVPEERREPGPVRVRVARPVLTQAVRQVADRAVVGLPDAWRKTVRDAAWRGAEGLPEALDTLVAEAAAESAGDGAATGAGKSPGEGGGRNTAGEHVPARMPRPHWWTVAMLAQGLLLSLQVVGVFLLVGAAFGAYRGAVWPPVLLVVGCAVGAPALAAGCRAAARGPARAYGQEEERRLRRLSAGCGRTRVLEPVAAELLRYREVREQYVVASGDADRM